MTGPDRTPGVPPNPGPLHGRPGPSARPSAPSTRHNDGRGDPRRGRNYPTAAWYVAATSKELGHALVARRLLDLPVVLYRTVAGQVVALEDRCAHRSFPLSLGELNGDNLVAGYHGFVYGPDGRCLRVPSQAMVPLGAQVRSLPVHEFAGFVWVWLGMPRLAARRPPPRPPWPVGEDDVTVIASGELDLAVNYLALHEALADVTHVTHISPDLSPPVLETEPPPVQVEVSEASVSFWRDYPASTIPAWHARAIGVPPDGRYRQHERGAFVAPGLWVDRWDVHHEEHIHGLLFTQGITPVDPSRTTLFWRVSRDPGSDQVDIDLQADEIMRSAFAAYYRDLARVLETIQAVHDRDGYKPEINVRADTAGLHIRRVVSSLLAEQRPIL